MPNPIPGQTISPALPWLSRLFRSDLRWLEGMSWQRVRWLFVIVLGFTVHALLGNIIRDGRWPWPTWLDFGWLASFWFLRYLVSFAPMLVALTVADNLPLRGGKRIAALAFAMVVGAQFQWPLVCALVPQDSESPCDGFPSFLWRSWTEMLGENTLFTIASTTTIALAYFYRRRDTRMAEALHAAELARTALQRKTLEADLQTMQARVEPAFLFETLGDIGELFDRDPAAGERMLDELIRYLRAALPDMRAARSTLRQEAALASAYLAILRIRAQGRLAFDVRVRDGLQDVAIPPMMLLPLLAAAIGPVADADGESTVHIDAIADAGRIRAAITGRGPAMRALNDTPTALDVRERLHALYGERASLTTDDEPGRRLTAVIEFPHETD